MIFDAEFVEASEEFETKFESTDETFKTEFITIDGAVRGESAYEAAVRNGFEGTEQEWLDSLKGKDGRDGKDGAKGDKGDKGDPGEKGDTGEKGQDGKDGNTPQKGVDYYTESDKQELIAELQDQQTFETWAFTLEDGTTVEKKVVIL